MRRLVELGSIHSSCSRAIGVAAFFAAVAFGGTLVSCGSSKAAAAARNAPPKTIAKDKFKGATRCDTSAPGREISYHDLSGRGRPDMVEVIGYTKSPSGMSEGRVVCMELDTNHDGVLDSLRVFAEQGDLESEEADRNYDGKSDVWVSYEKGSMVKQAFDNQFRGTGQATEFHYYRDGKLKRIERDRNGDGKIDVWEFYVNGQLERMGIDLDHDGKVDVWYRDEVARAEAKKTATPAPSATPQAGAPSSGAPPPPARKTKEAE